MPDPIQSSIGPNQSYYDPSEQVSRAPETSAASPAVASAPPAATSSSAPAGKDVLLKKYGSGQEECTKYAIAAGVSFVAAGASAATGLMTAPSGIGAVLGGVGMVANIIKGAIDVRNYVDCQDRNAAAAAAATDCNAQGGVLLDGAGDSSSVCLIP